MTPKEQFDAMRDTLLEEISFLNSLQNDTFDTYVIRQAKVRVEFIKNLLLDIEV